MTTTLRINGKSEVRDYNKEDIKEIPYDEFTKWSEYDNPFEYLYRLTGCEDRNPITKTNLYIKDEKGNAINSGLCTTNFDIFYVTLE